MTKSVRARSLVADASGGHEREAEREHVARHDELQLGGRGAEGRLDGRQRHVDLRQVEDRQAGDRHAHPVGTPALGIRERDRQRGRLRRLRHPVHPTPGVVHRTGTKRGRHPSGCRPPKWTQGDSNPRPSHCERDALPTAPWARARMSLSSPRGWFDIDAAAAQPAWRRRRSTASRSSNAGLASSMIPMRAYGLAASAARRSDAAAAGLRRSARVRGPARARSTAPRARAARPGAPPPRPPRRA